MVMVRKGWRVKRLLGRCCQVARVLQDTYCGQNDQSGVLTCDIRVDSPLGLLGVSEGGEAADTEGDMVMLGEMCDSP